MRDAARSTFAYWRRPRCIAGMFRKLGVSLTGHQHARVKSTHVEQEATR